MAHFGADPDIDTDIDTVSLDEALDSQVTTSDLSSISLCLFEYPRAWSQIGLSLKVPYSEITNIEDSNNKDAFLKTAGMINAWICMGEECTWRTLRDALKKLKYNGLADKIVVKAKEASESRPRLQPRERLNQAQVPAITGNSNQDRDEKQEAEEMSVEPQNKGKASVGSTNSDQNRDEMARGDKISTQTTPTDIAIEIADLYSVDGEKGEVSNNKYLSEPLHAEFYQKEKKLEEKICQLFKVEDEARTLNTVNTHVQGKLSLQFEFSDVARTLYSMAEVYQQHSGHVEEWANELLNPLQEYLSEHDKLIRQKKELEKVAKNELMLEVKPTEKNVKWNQCMKKLGIIESNVKRIMSDMNICQGEIKEISKKNQYLETLANSCKTVYKGSQYSSTLVYIALIVWLLKLPVYIIIAAVVTLGFLIGLTLYLFSSVRTKAFLFYEISCFTSSSIRRLTCILATICLTLAHQPLPTKTEEILLQPTGIPSVTSWAVGSAFGFAVTTIIRLLMEFPLKKAVFAITVFVIFVLGLMYKYFTIDWDALAALVGGHKYAIPGVAVGIIGAGTVGLLDDEMKKLSGKIVGAIVYVILLYLGQVLGKPAGFFVFGGEVGNTIGSLIGSSLMSLIGLALASSSLLPYFLCLYYYIDLQMADTIKCISKNKHTLREKQELLNGHMKVSPVHY